MIFYFLVCNIFNSTKPAKRLHKMTSKLIYLA